MVLNAQTSGVTICEIDVASDEGEKKYSILSIRFWIGATGKRTHKKTTIFDHIA